MHSKHSVSKRLNLIYIRIGSLSKRTIHLCLAEKKYNAVIVMYKLNILNFSCFETLITSWTRLISLLSKYILQVELILFLFYQDTY